MGVMKLFGVIAAFLLIGCSKTVNECSVDSDCKDVAYPFCDVNGDFGPSGGAKNVCTIVPPDCPIERCGCSPGATSCTGDTLSVCNADGKSTTDTSCSLGCASTNDRCQTFQPSNGLGAALVAAAGTSDVLIPDGSRIDTNSGMVFDPANFPITVGSVVTSQANGVDIRAYYALSFDVGNVTIIGTKAVAFVAQGPVTISGLVDASANAHTPGPGATVSGACISLASSNGIGGGGGNATPGGAGTNGSVSQPGGAAQTAFEPLAGGCAGGGASSGAGGGAIQIDSLTKISVSAVSGSQRGILHVGGGGGTDGQSGGGSGGLVILEAPQVLIGGAITANGGGGGGGLNNPGADATPDGNTAFGGSNPQLLGYGGSGASIGGPPGDASNFGGGGGALGRLYVRSADGTYGTVGGALISATPSSSVLAIH